MIHDEIKPEWVKNQNGTNFLVTKQNDKFEKYFFEQKTCETEEEWQKCLEVMRTDLPQAFRLNTSKKKTMLKLKNVLERKCKDNLTEKPWAEGVFQFDKSRWDLKLSHPDLIEFMMNERICGNLSRQELVSMIPVFLLDVQPHHRILDMCASPGSKTKHLLELMHSKLYEVSRSYNFLLYLSLSWYKSLIFVPP